MFEGWLTALRQIEPRSTIKLEEEILASSYLTLSDDIINHLMMLTTISLYYQQYDVCSIVTFSMYNFNCGNIK